MGHRFLLAVAISALCVSPAWAEENPFEATPGGQGETAKQSADLPAEATDAPRYFAESHPDHTKELQELLNRKLPDQGLDFEQVPLEEIVEFLADHLHTNIELDRQALDDVGVDAAQPVNARFRNISCGSALREMLRSLGLTYIIRNEMILITTTDAAEQDLRVAVYVVNDLADQKFHARDHKHIGDTPPELYPLVDTLVSTVATDTWAENGGGEAEVQALRPGLLVISQTSAVHEEIARVLASIRQAKKFVEQNPAAASQQADAAMPTEAMLGAE